MLARCGCALVALAICLNSSSAYSQEADASGGTLTLPDNLFSGDATSSSSGASVNDATQSVVTGTSIAPTYVEGAPMSYSGAGSSYSPSLGGHLRARYNSQSYGQVAGNLDLGTMFMHQELDTAWFLDGQVTLNDESHVGFNVGLGVRTLADWGYCLLADDQKIVGLSIWADGSSTVNNNFFPQLGFSYELLGDRWDLRANASFVLSDQMQVGDESGLGSLGYQEFNLVEQTLAGRDSAMHLTELEVARRLGDLELWGFLGGYGLYGENDVDTAGYKLGVRGYATPDLALQFAMTDDDLFDTNAVVSLTWFIGRTRTNTPFTCDLRDRFREPVIRNDYVAVYQDTVTGGDALTNDFDGDGESEDIRFVHVDSSATAGGDGTFENPFNTLDSVTTGNSQENDVILVHSDSTFSNHAGVVLQGGQRLLGEGNELTFAVATDQYGAIVIPETAPNAQEGATPIVNNAAGISGVTLADSNEVANLTLNDGAQAIVAGTNGAGDPNLHDLTIDGATADGIVLTPLERVENGETTIAFNATLDNITFNNVGGNDIDIDATTTSDPTDADVTLNESIAISNITSTGGGDFSLNVSNTTEGGTLSVDSYNWDGGVTSAGGMTFSQTGGTVNVTNSELTGGASGAIGFQVTGNTGIVTIGSSNTVTDINGQAAEFNQTEEQIDFAATVENTTVAGGTVTVVGNEAAVRINSDSITTLDETSVNIVDAMANVTVSSEITRDGVVGQAVVITDTNSGDDDPDDGIEILFSEPAATITSNDGSMAVWINGGDDNVSFTGDIVDTGGTLVENRTGGQVTFSGVLNADTGANDAVVLTNNADDSIVSFSGMEVVTTGGRGFVADSGEVNATGTNTIEITGATTGGLVLQGTVANPITTTSGITFDSVDVAAGSTNPIVVENVEGSVTVNGGTINSTGDAIQVTNATDLALNDVTIASTGGTAVSASYTNDQSGVLSLSEVDAGGGDFEITSATTDSGASTVVTMTDVTNGGEYTHVNNGQGAASSTLIDVETNGGFDLDATSDGGLTASLTRVTGSGATTFDVTGAGDGSLTMNTVTTDGLFDYETSAAGDLTVSMTDVTGSGATTFDVTGAGDGLLTMNEVTTDGLFDYETSGAGGLTVSMTDVTGNGATTFDVNDSGAGTLTMNTVTTSGSFDYNAAGAGNLTASMSSVTGAGATTLDVTSTGNGTLTMTTVNTGGTIAANSSAASTGDMSLTANNSGGTTEFGNITINDQGDGDVTASLSNTDSAGNVDFDSAGDGTASLTITGGSYDGDVTSDADNTGTATTRINGGADIGGAVAVNATSNVTTFTADVTGSSDIDGTLSVNAANDGAATVFIDGDNTIDGATSVTLTNNGAATVNLGSVHNDTLTVAANNVGTLEVDMSGATINAGAAAVGFTLDIDDQVTDASVTLSNNSYDSGVSILADNAQDFSLQADTENVVTGSDHVAFSLLVDSSVNKADILIANSTYDTNVASAMEYVQNAGSVNFQLDDNTISSSSVADPAANLLASSGTFNATIGMSSTSGSGNTFANGSNPSNQLVVTGDGVSTTVNLLLSGNTANSGSGNFNLVESNSATFGVTDLTNVDNGSLNSGTVNFDPNLAAFDDLGVTEPQLPGF